MNASKNDNDSRKIFVGGLSWESTADDLKTYFERFGQVLDVTLKTDLATGRSRGFGFVLFGDEETVERVVRDKNHVLHGKSIDPKRVVPGGTLGGTGGYGKKIFVGGLDPSLTEDDVKDYFSQYGKVEQVDLPFDKVKNQRRAFGFITFESEETVKEICANEKLQFGDKLVDIRKVVSKDQLNGGGRGGRGGATRGRGGPMAGAGFGAPMGYDYNGTYAAGYPGYDYYGGTPGGAYAAPGGYTAYGGAPQAWAGGYDQSAQAAYGQPAPAAGPAAAAGAYGGYDYSGGWQGTDTSAYGKVKRGGGAAAPAAPAGGFHPYSR